LREQIERSRSEAERNAADAGNSRELYRQADSNEKELTGCLRKAIADATTAKKNHETVEKKWNDEVAKCGALRDQLALEWHTTTLLELNTFEEAQKGYLESRIVNRFQELQSDERMRAEWERQLDDVNVQIESIPMADHVSVVVAEQQHRVAKSDFQQAEVDLRTAEVATTELKKRAEEFTTLVQTITTVERDWSLHERLDELLGKKGLQRELVRDAEQQIVGFAQETVRQLSDGELSIELDRTESSDDQAFLLNVRRGDGSTAIPVEYLSGSQKFRVAVAIALAIGRFAAGQARPLECVIIDEGFGSLDRDGLRATAEELNRLRGKLRRIILVSHQEEFTEHFPVVIQLSKGENGTCVEMRRR